MEQVLARLICSHFVTPNDLKQADLLVWTDSLVCPGILDLAPENCERVRTSTLTLEQVVPHLINGHRQGKRVVRLHDDTALYSAINEQICARNDADLPVEVIPGISAYQAAAATLRENSPFPGWSRRLCSVALWWRTGIPETEELDRLASLRSSLCLYLSARACPGRTTDVAQLHPPDTPVAIAHRVSWPDEWISIVPLHAMARTSLERNLIRTTLYIVSPALQGSNDQSFILRARPSISPKELRCCGLRSICAGD